MKPFVFALFSTIQIFMECLWHVRYCPGSGIQGWVKPDWVCWSSFVFQMFTVSCVLICLRSVTLYFCWLGERERERASEQWVRCWWTRSVLGEEGARVFFSEFHAELNWLAYPGVNQQQQTESSRKGGNLEGIVRSIQKKKSEDEEFSLPDSNNLNAKVQSRKWHASRVGTDKQTRRAEQRARKRTWQVIAVPDKWLIGTPYPWGKDGLLKRWCWHSIQLKGRNKGRLLPYTINTLCRGGIQMA